MLIKLSPLEQPDLGSYCLQYRLPKNISRRVEQTTKVGEKDIICKAYDNFIAFLQQVLINSLIEEYEGMLNSILVYDNRIIL